MYLRFAVVAVAWFGSVAVAGERPMVIVGEGVTPAQAEALVRAAGASGVEIVQAREPAPPSSAEVLEEARRLFREMDFQRAALRLSAAEPNLIDGRTPNAALLSSLGELELWLGACLQFSHNAPDAAERFALVRALDPNARPDPVFPPEVARAFEHTSAPAPIAVRVHLAPAEARLWIDGRPADAAPRLRPGLHYVVGERADRRPVARMLRIAANQPDITLSLGDIASQPESLAQAARQAKRGALGRQEGTAVAALQGRPLWIVRSSDGRASLTRWSTDPAEEPRTIPLDRLEKAAAVACRAEHACTDETLPGGAPTPALVERPAPSAQPRTAVWKRGWFWAVLGGGAALLAGGIATAVVVTAPRDYAPHF